MADDDDLELPPQVRAKLEADPALCVEWRRLLEEIDGGRMTFESPEYIAFTDRLLRHDEPPRILEAKIVKSTTGKATGKLGEEKKSAPELVVEGVEGWRQRQMAEVHQQQKLEIKDINDLLRLSGPGTARAVIERASLLEPLQPEEKTPHDGGRGGGDHSEPPERKPGLPSDCPVKMLGVDEMHTFSLDSGQRLIRLHARDHGRLHLAKLFGGNEVYLKKHWGRRKKIHNERTGKFEWITDGVHWEHLAQDMIATASALGDWNPSERVRGPGAWRNDKDELVNHCGNCVLTGLRIDPPGLIDGYVYPAKPTLTRPFHLSVKGGETAIGARVIAILKCWNLGHGVYDAELLLGFIGCAMIGGALLWRPMAWISGDTGTGKTMLLSLLKAIFGKRVIALADPSAAGIWQRLEQSTLLITIDEQEPRDDTRVVEQILRLLRMATSGAVMVRGSATHEFVEFVIQSCFLLSSVVIPPLLPQDRNRIVVFSLGALPSVDAPKIEAKVLGEYGQQILRRLIDNWPDWSAVHETYHRALINEGLGARGSDLYAALLTAAELIRRDDHDGLADDAADWAVRLSGYGLGAFGDDLPDQLQCFERLLTTQVPLDSGSFRRPVREWIWRWLAATPFEHESQDPQRVLSGYGLQVVNADDGCYVAVAYQHSELEKIYRGTHWGTKSGAIGPWRQALGRLDGAHASKNPAYYRNQGNTRAVLVPLKHVFPPDGD